MQNVPVGAFDPADDREVWYLPGALGDEGTLILNAHPKGACAGKNCAIHNPSEHWACHLPAKWLFDRGIGGRMVRLCRHGNVHEDPDDQGFRVSRGMPVPKTQACDCGCCNDQCLWEAPF